MKAVVCKAYGPPEQLEIVELAPLIPVAGQVVIAVKACAVNFPDTLIIQGLYQYKPPLPFTPGSDVAGIVKAVGAGVDPALVGQRVVAFTSTGGFAEEVIGNAHALISIPESIDFASAASFVMTYGTAYHALHDRAQLQPGETVLVLGAAGGVGLATIDLAKLLGARVIAAASSSEKLELCRRYGADASINYQSENLRESVKQLTGGKGVDVIFDPVGGQYTEPAVRSMAWNGRYLIIGFAAGDIPRIPLNLPLLKVCSLVGVFLGSFAEHDPRRHQENLETLRTWLVEGKIKPYVSARYALEDAARALNDIIERKVTGKVVLVPQSLGTAAWSNDLTRR